MGSVEGENASCIYRSCGKEIPGLEHMPQKGVNVTTDFIFIVISSFIQTYSPVMVIFKARPILPAQLAKVQLIYQSPSAGTCSAFFSYPHHVPHTDAGYQVFSISKDHANFR
jgi:hypothetical protein